MATTESPWRWHSTNASGSYVRFNPGLVVSEGAGNEGNFSVGPIATDLWFNLTTEPPVLPGSQELRVDLYPPGCVTQDAALTPPNCVSSQTTQEGVLSLRIESPAEGVWTFDMFRAEPGIWGIDWKMTATHRLPADRDVPQPPPEERTEPDGPVDCLLNTAPSQWTQCLG